MAPFYETWRTALQMAKELGSPGIVFDPEAYNDRSMYNLANLAAVRHTTTENVSSQLRQIGAKLADIVSEEYPDVVVFSLFTQYGEPSANAMSVPTLFDGFLEEAAKRNIPLALVDGGETLGYCVRSLADFQRRQEQRIAYLRPVMHRFPHHYFLAATLAPWADAAKRNGAFLQRSACVHSDMKTIGDFKPVFVWLLRQFGYVWVYGSPAAPYRPLNSQDQAVYDPVLIAAKRQADSLGPIPLPRAP